jgi:uncharacterized protein (TIGR00369 family)
MTSRGAGLARPRRPPQYAPVSETAPPPPPEGFQLAPSDRPSFSTHNGPYYLEPGRDRGARNAFFPDVRHANGYGVVHGGVISAFLDGVMAQAVTQATTHFGVTVQLSLSYLAAAKPGEWIIAEADVVRATRELAFLEGRVTSGEREIVRATAVFKIMPKR